jgi:uncharacterized protein
MRNTYLFFLLFPMLLIAEMRFSDPKPTFEKPRRWLLRLYTHNLDVVNKNLDAINNVLKVYPTETLRVAVIVYSSGMRALQKSYDPKTLSRIRALQEYDVEFIACVNTMDTMQWNQEMFLEGLNYVQAGIAESIERMARGWIDVTPYTVAYPIKKPSSHLSK